MPRLRVREIHRCRIGRPGSVRTIGRPVPCRRKAGRETPVSLPCLTPCRDGMGLVGRIRNTHIPCQVRTHSILLLVGCCSSLRKVDRSKIDAGSECITRKAGGMNRCPSRFGSMTLIIDMPFKAFLSRGAPGLRWSRNEKPFFQLSIQATMSCPATGQIFLACRPAVLPSCRCGSVSEKTYQTRPGGRNTIGPWCRRISGNGSATFVTYRRKVTLP